MFPIGRSGINHLILQNPETHIKCEGMYSRTAWGGSVEPFILTKFQRYVSTGEDDPNTDPVVAFVLFDWKDQEQIGVQPDPNSWEVRARPGLANLLIY